MSIVQAIPTSFKAECMQGVHTSADVYKMALYTSAATLSAATTTYTTVGEVVGTGYTAGGVTLNGIQVVTDGTTTILDWTTDPSWTNATITARGALIYNSSKANRAVYVLDFAADKTSTDGTFAVFFPAPTASSGLVRF